MGGFGEVFVVLSCGLSLWVEEGDRGICVRCVRCERGGYYLFASRSVVPLGVFVELSPFVELSSARGDSVVDDCTKRVVGGVEGVGADGGGA